MRGHNKTIPVAQLTIHHRTRLLRQRRFRIRFYRNQRTAIPFLNAVRLTYGFQIAVELDLVPRAANVSSKGSDALVEGVTPSLRPEQDEPPLSNANVATLR